MQLHSEDAFSLPDFKQQGAVLNELLLPMLTFCPLGLLQSFSFIRNGRVRGQGYMSGGVTAMHNTTVCQGAGGESWI